MDTLPSPFKPVTDVDMVFGGIPNMDEAIRACPTEFRRDTGKGYHRLADDFFFNRLTQEQKEEVTALMDDSKFTPEKMKYIWTWLKSYHPGHEDKVAVVAWCLSQIMTAPPSFTLR